MNVARKVARNVIYRVLGLLVGSISGLFLTIILARILKPEQFGIYSLASAIAMLAIALANLGIDGAVIRYTAYYAKIYNLAKIRGSFRYFLKIKTAVATSVSLLLIIFSDRLATLFGDERLTLPFIFAGIIVFWASFANLFNAFFIGLQEFRYNFLKQVVYEVARWTFVIPLSSLYLALGALAGFSVAYIISLIFLILIIITKYREFVFGYAEKTDKKINTFIGFMTIASISGIVYTYVDSIMIGYFLTPVDVGYYRAAYTIVFAIIGLLSSLGDVLFPTFTQLSLEDINRSLGRLLKYTSVIAFPLTFIITYMSEEIIKIIYGVDYITASSAMAILSFALIPGAFSYFGVIFSAKEKPEINAILVIVGMLLNVILNYRLIPLLGIAGAALATVTSRFFVLFLSIIILYRLLGILLNFKIALKPLISTLVMSLVLFMFRKPESLEMIVLELTIAGFIYFSTLFMVRGLTLEDLKYIKKVLF